MLILLELTFASIFNFSIQDGQTSSGLSRKVARKIIDVFPYTKNLSEKTKNKIVEMSQPIIRKGAHLSIYTLVGIPIMSFISNYSTLNIYKCSRNVISDEKQQNFILGSKLINRYYNRCMCSVLGIIIVWITIFNLKGEK